MNTQIKNSKKGFTLVELVVVIAILAILAAIAIPVVNSVINTASRNGALTNAQSIELAIKQCQANIAARNGDVYSGQKINGVQIPNIALGANGKDGTAGYKSITIQHVALVNGITNAFKTVSYNAEDYAPYWDTSTESCVYLSADGKDLESGAAYANTGSCKALSSNEQPVTDTKATIYDNLKNATTGFSKTGSGSTPTSGT